MQATTGDANSRIKSLSGFRGWAIGLLTFGTMVVLIENSIIIGKAILSSKHYDSPTNYFFMSFFLWFLFWAIGLIGAIERKPVMIILHLIPSFLILHSMSSQFMKACSIIDSADEAFDLKDPVWITQTAKKLSVIGFYISVEAVLISYYVELVMNVERVNHQQPAQVAPIAQQCQMVYHQQGVQPAQPAGVVYPHLGASAPPYASASGMVY